MATPKSKLSRRKFIAGVAAGGVAAQLPVALRAADAPAAPTPASPADLDTLAAAEKLAAISFTPAPPPAPARPPPPPAAGKTPPPFSSPPAQREPLVKGVLDRVPNYAALRTPPTPNTVFPALTFSPALAGIRPPSGPITRIAT